MMAALLVAAILLPITGAQVLRFGNFGLAVPPGFVVEARKVGPNTYRPVLVAIQTTQHDSRALKARVKQPTNLGSNSAYTGPYAGPAETHYSSQPIDTQGIVYGSRQHGDTSYAAHDPLKGSYPSTWSENQGTRADAGQRTQVSVNPSATFAYANNVLNRARAVNVAQGYGSNPVLVPGRPVYTANGQRPGTIYTPPRYIPSMNIVPLLPNPVVKNLHPFDPPTYRSPPMKPISPVHPTNLFPFPKASDAPPPLPIIPPQKRDTQVEYGSESAGFAIPPNQHKVQPEVFEETVPPQGSLATQNVEYAAPTETMPTSSTEKTIKTTKKLVTEPLIVTPPLVEDENEAFNLDYSTAMFPSESYEDLLGEGFFDELHGSKETLSEFIPEQKHTETAKADTESVENALEEAEYAFDIPDQYVDNEREIEIPQQVIDYNEFVVPEQQIEIPEQTLVEPTEVLDEKVTADATTETMTPYTIEGLEEWLATTQNSADNKDAVPVGFEDFIPAQTSDSNQLEPGQEPGHSEGIEVASCKNDLQDRLNEPEAADFNPVAETDKTSASKKPAKTEEDFSQVTDSFYDTTEAILPAIVEDIKSDENTKVTKGDEEKTVVLDPSSVSFSGEIDEDYFPDIFEQLNGASKQAELVPAQEHTEKTQIDIETVENDLNVPEYENLDQLDKTQAESDIIQQINALELAEKEAAEPAVIEAVHPVGVKAVDPEGVEYVDPEAVDPAPVLEAVDHKEEAKAISEAAQSQLETQPSGYGTNDKEKADGSFPNYRGRYAVNWYNPAPVFDYANRGKSTPIPALTAAAATEPSVTQAVVTEQPLEMEATTEEIAPPAPSIESEEMASDISRDTPEFPKIGDDAGEILAPPPDINLGGTDYPTEEILGLSIGLKKPVRFSNKLDSEIRGVVQSKNPDHGWQPNWQQLPVPPAIPPLLIPPNPRAHASPPAMKPREFHRELTDSEIAQFPETFDEFFGDEEFLAEDYDGFLEEERPPTPSIVDQALPNLEPNVQAPTVAPLTNTDPRIAWQDPTETTTTTKKPVKIPARWLPKPRVRKPRWEDFGELAGPPKEPSRRSRGEEPLRKEVAFKLPWESEDVAEERDEAVRGRGDQGTGTRKKGRNDYNPLGRGPFDLGQLVFTTHAPYGLISEGTCGNYDRECWEMGSQATIYSHIEDREEAERVSSRKFSGISCTECLNMCIDVTRQLIEENVTCQAAVYDHRENICLIFNITGQEHDYIHYISRYPGRDYYRPIYEQKCHRTAVVDPIRTRIRNPMVTRPPIFTTVDPIDKLLNQLDNQPQKKRRN